MMPPPRRETVSSVPGKHAASVVFTMRKAAIKRPECSARGKRTRTTCMTDESDTVKTSRYLTFKDLFPCFPLLRIRLEKATRHVVTSTQNSLVENMEVRVM